MNLPADSPLWEGHRDGSGNPTGTYYGCGNSDTQCLAGTVYYWQDVAASTPAKPGVDPVTVVRSAVSSLGLHAPTVGVGAYVYPGYQQWGLSWWVGAPMWLWVDSTDALQWGTQSVSASADGVTVTATVTATSVSFDPGDGSEPVTCATPGTVRPWDPEDPLSHHSPTGCEYTYLQTNTLGDVGSRFVVSATVTWTVVWSSTDGQHGTFTTNIASTDNPSIHVGDISVVLTTPGK
ncbi:MAG: hypothetical protein FWF25_01490 [Propionibacteriaceae bacterium]|nr:hypothetical protein [Propionibacteriaceae bacterium]